MIENAQGFGQEATLDDFTLPIRQKKVMNEDIAISTS
jgi:hypothetical protein